MRNVTIVESNVEPNKEHLWFYNGKLKWFGPNGWEEIYSQALSPTTTLKPVVPPTTTTSTTSTDFPTLKLINNTGDTLNVTGYIFVEGGIGSDIPPVPNGGSVFLLKTSRPEGINLRSVSNYRLGMIIDSEDKGELSTNSTTPYLNYIIPRSIFINANEISVYNVDA